jgi:hypothetical protein
MLTRRSDLFHPAKQRVDETWNFLSEQVIELLYRTYTRLYKTALIKGCALAFETFAGSAYRHLQDPNPPLCSA